MEQEQKNIKMLLLLYVGTKYLQTEKYFLQMVQYENMLPHRRLIAYSPRECLSLA